jgi:hypothetical protein
MSGAPPSDPPDRLFRTLLAWRPSRPLRTEVAGFRLRARALSPAEEAAAFDAGAEEELLEVRTSRFQRELLARCLYIGDRPAFASAEEVGLLSGAAIAALAGEAAETLDAIAPTYARSDVAAWRKVLREGAEHIVNVSTTFTLAGCVDITPGGGHLPRLDRFWGHPAGELLDGHWLAYEAARAVMEKHRK